MAIRIDISEEIDRRVPVVFEFYVVNHVRNHPRWGPLHRALAGLGRTDRRRDRHSKAQLVTTAPTTAQVDAILWRYIGSAHRKAEVDTRMRAVVQT
jgi:hypothetical protein